MIHRGAIAFLGAWLLMAVVFSSAVLGYMIPTDRPVELSGVEVVPIILAIGFLASVPVALGMGLREFVRTRDDLVTHLAAALRGR